MKNKQLFLVLVLLLLMAAIIIGIRFFNPGAVKTPETSAEPTVVSPEIPQETKEPGLAFESHEEDEVPELNLEDETVIVLDETQGVGGF